MNDIALAPVPAGTSAQLTVNLVYLARLREAFGAAGETLVLAGRDHAPVRDVVDILRARGDAYARELAPERTFRIAVNHAMAAQDAIVRSGDEVAFFPPVTGG
jgi:molybdopterin synthase sulfur carrier subunit